VATGNSKRQNVQLIVQARAEGERLVESLTDALHSLSRAQEQVGGGAARSQSQMAQLGAALEVVAAIMPKITAASDRASEAFERQQATLARTRAELEAIRRQTASAAAAIAATQSKIIDTKLAGGDTSGLVAQLQEAESAYNGLVAQQGRLRTSVHAQEAALGQARSSLQIVSSAANATEAAIASVGDAAQQAAAIAAVAAEKQAQAWRDEAAAAREAAEQQRNADRFANFMGVTDNPRGRIARDSAAAIKEQLDAEDALAAALDHIRSRMEPLAAVDARLNADLANLKKALDAGRISAEEFAQTEEFLRQEALRAGEAIERQGRGANGKPSLFGLKPYELTNLGYQINDIVSGLAMGQRPMQILAQQGGQVLQLFPKLGAAITSSIGNPATWLAAAAFGAIAASVARAMAENDRMKTFEGLVQGIGDGANYSAAGLKDAADEIQHMGVAATAANAAVTTFVRAGVNPQLLTNFGQAARDMADAMGVEVPQAAQQVATAFTGTYQQIQQLQQATGFLTAAENEHIRTLFEEGRAGQARLEALRLFTDRMNHMAEQARGPWSTAGRAFGRVWDSVISAIGNSPAIQQKIIELNEFADALERLTGAGQGAAQQLATPAQAAAELATAQRALSIIQHLHDLRPNDAEISAQLRAAEQRVAAARNGLDPRDPRSTAAQQESLEVARDHARAMALIDLQGRYQDLTDADQRYGEVRDANQRIAIQGQIAFNRVLDGTHNRQRALNAQLEAEAQERQRINQAQRQGAEQNIQRFARRVVGVESGGDPNARNSRSTATGTGQFIESTWLSLFRKYFPDQAASMSQTAILELRRNQTVSLQLIQLYARENATVLQRAGQAVTQANLYLAHFLGPQGALSVLRAAPSAQLSDVLPANVIRANPNLRGRTAGQLIARVQGQFGDSGPEAQDRQAILDQIAQQEAQRAVQQDAFNRRVDQENAARQVSIEQQRRLLGLSGDALLDEQRRQAVEDAVNAAQQEAARQQLTLDDARKQMIEQTTAAEFDLLHARERATKAVDDATAERQALQERQQQALQNGDMGLYAELGRQIEAVNQRLRDGIAVALRYWQQFNTPEAHAAIQGLMNLRDGIERAQEAMERAPAEQQSERLQAVRQGLQEQIEFFRNQGNNRIADQLTAQLRGVDAALVQTIDYLVKLWSGTDDPRAQQMILQFQNLRNTVVSTRDQFRIFAGDIQQAFAGDLTNAAMQWAQTIGEGGNAIRATADLFRSFASSFIRDIAQMLLKAAALKLAMKIGFGGLTDGLNALLGIGPLVAASAGLTAAGGTLTAAGTTLTAAAVPWAAVAGQLMAAATTLMIANSTGIGLLHGGGVVGAGFSMHRNVSPALFTGAMRFHGGGLPGLAADEVPAILKKREEVLSANDPRNILNGGGAGMGAAPDVNVSVKNVNVVDGADILAQGFASRRGEQVVFNFISKNRSSVRAALGV